MKYAWIENDKIRDIAPGTPSEFYHQDVAVFYNTEVPDEAVNGDGWVNGQVVKPTAPEPVVQPRTWTANDVRNGLNLSEKVKWDNDSAPEVVTAKQELLGQKELEAVTEVLQMLVDASVISQASMDKILA